MRSDGTHLTHLKSCICGDRPHNTPDRAPPWTALRDQPRRAAKPRPDRPRLADTKPTTYRDHYRHDGRLQALGAALFGVRRPSPRAATELSTLAHTIPHHRQGIVNGSSWDLSGGSQFPGTPSFSHPPRGVHAGDVMISTSLYLASWQLPLLDSRQLADDSLKDTRARC